MKKIILTILVAALAISAQAQVNINPFTESRSIPEPKGPPEAQPAPSPDQPAAIRKAHRIMDEADIEMDALFPSVLDPADQEAVRSAMGKLGQIHWIIVGAHVELSQAFFPEKNWSWSELESHLPYSCKSVAARINRAYDRLWKLDHYLHFWHQKQQGLKDRNNPGEPY